MIDGRPITITTGSMNRKGALRKALRTWSCLHEVDHIIIVDWSSTEPLNEVLRDFMELDSRIRVVRIVDQKHWCNSKCHNLEIRLVPEDNLLLRLDIDTLVRHDFFARHSYRPGTFYAGNWRTVLDEVDDKRNLTGTLFIDPAYLLRVNGYNERLIHYGREDDELYARLAVEGYRWQELDLDTLEHLTHADRARYENLSIAPEVSKEAAKLVKQAQIWNDHGSGTDVRQMLVALSNQILADKPWTPTDRMTKWTCRQVSDNYWEGRETKTANKEEGP